MVRRAQAALRSVEHTSVRQLRVLAAIVFLFAMVIATVAPAVTAPMAFAVAKGNDDLLEKINAGLANVKENGVYDELVEKWEMS